MKRTPLYERHVALGAKFTDFGGWTMPVQYTNIINEHQTTRHAAGLFDICHMGQIEVKGPQSFSFLQRVMSRNLEGQADGQIKLCVMTNEDGGIMDDLTVYKFGSENYMIVTNASTLEKDFVWLKAQSKQQAFDKLEIKDISNATGKLDLQGPKAQEILQPLLSEDLGQLRFYRAMQTTIIDTKVIISRSGYTGEDGFEIYTPADRTGGVWDAILDAGSSHGVKPVGLGARDTLRLEAGMMLYGHEMDNSITPFEVVYDWLADLNKEFIGCEALKKRKQAGISRRLVGFEIIGRGIARNGYGVLRDGRTVGNVTSGTFSPTLGKAIGMAFLPIALTHPGTEIDIEIRNNVVKAMVVPLPFYRRNK